ncbi:MAG: phytanoyl-CoA dioxygenase family protein [Oscillatoriales cyanobacterium SM2_1_8]|nr:phytanoyl-CoA dioxygenase family protein [Oscillatoriales cyanobacterium SM2_1_8]
MQDAASLAQEIVQGKGYILLPALFTLEEVSEARLHILKLAQEEPAGRLLKVGERSRLYRLLEEAAIFERMVQHPQVMEVVEAVLGSDMTLGGFSAHILYPGASRMGAHVDYPYFTMTPPYPATPVMAVQAIWMMEDFTETNGAPLFAANTQKLHQFPDAAKFSEIAEKVTGTAGSVVLSHGLCWHDTSSNHAEQPRVSVLGNYNPKFVRPLENPAQHLSSNFLEQVSPKLRQLLGYEFQAAILKDVQKLQSKNRAVPERANPMG